MTRRRTPRLPKYCTRLRIANPIVGSDHATTMMLCSRKQIALGMELRFNHPDLTDLKSNIPVQCKDGLFEENYYTDFLLTTREETKAYLINDGNVVKRDRLINYWNDKNITLVLVDPARLDNHVRTNNIQKILKYINYNISDKPLSAEDHRKREAALQDILHLYQTTTRSIVDITAACAKKYHLPAEYGINLFYYLLAQHRLTIDIDSAPIDLVNPRLPKGPLMADSMDVAANSAEINKPTLRPVDQCMIGTALISHGIIYRVAAVEPDLVWLIRMDKEYVLPSPLPRKELNRKLETREYEFYTLEEAVPPDFPSTEAAAKALNEQNKWIHAFGEALYSPRLITNKNYRNRIIRSISLPRQNVLRHLIKFWQSGSDPEAFLPGYRFSGRRKGSFDLGDYDKQAIDRIIRKCILQTDAFSLERAYDQLRVEFYPDHAEYAPTKDQFDYQVTKYREAHPEEYAMARDGKADYPLTSRETLLQSDYGLPGPGQIYLVDATQIDYYVVDRYNPAIVIGRPTLFLLVDAFSRAITGMYISINSESLQTARLLLFSGFTDKVEYCRNFNIEITEEDWPYHFIPQLIKCDNSEMSSFQLNGLVEDLASAIEQVLPGRGDLKPLVETKFNYINTILGAMIDGHVQKRLQHRHSNTTLARQKACLTLPEMREIIIKCIITYNKYHVLEDYRIAPDMTALDMKFTPEGLWNWGIQHRTGMLRTASRARIYAATLPPAEAVITPRGMVFHKLSYCCKQAEQRGWFVASSENKYQKIGIHYDPEDTGSIYYLPTARELEGTNDPTLWHLKIWTENYQTYAGLSETEADNLAKRQKELERSLKKQEEEARLELQQSEDAVIKAARQRKKSALQKEADSTLINSPKRNSYNERCIEKKENDALNPLRHPEHVEPATAG